MIKFEVSLPLTQSDLTLLRMILDNSPIHMGDESPVGTTVWTNEAAAALAPEIAALGDTVNDVTIQECMPAPTGVSNVSAQPAAPVAQPAVAVAPAVVQPVVPAPTPVAPPVAPVAAPVAPVAAPAQTAAAPAQVAPQPAAGDQDPRTALRAVIAAAIGQYNVDAINGANEIATQMCNVGINDVPVESIPQVIAAIQQRFPLQPATAVAGQTPAVDSMAY